MRLLILICFFISTTVFAQDTGIFIQKTPGYYENVILKEQPTKESLKPFKKRKVYIMDQSNYDLPNKKDLYTYSWHFPSISQGNSGTCWCFSTISFYESEINRLTNREVKLSEMFVVYYEYLLKAKRCIQTKDTAALASEGSEANAVKRIIKMYGIVPEDVFIGKPSNRVFYNHDSLVKTMKSYFRYLKRTKLWDEQKNLDSVEAILHTFIGVIPKTFKYEGKSYTPLSFLSFLQFKPDDYIDILSYKQDSFFKMVEYKVPDNWWHDSSYYNVPVDTFMVILKNAIKKGYTVCIGGDVSEAGFNRFTQCALVPSFDIPSALINDDARQFRFSNQTTTDDHGMHVVGYTIKDGKTWFLLKDSGSGSRNNDITKPEFGYFFVSEDYVKLKMMDFHVHKDALKIKE